MDKMDKTGYHPFMSITLFRRHRPGCTGQHPADSYSIEAEERRKGWKPCRCKIYARGSLNGLPKQVATKCRDFASARIAAQPYIDAGRWDIGPILPPPAPPAGPEKQPASSKDRTVPAAIEKFLADCRRDENADSTLANYKSNLGDLERFSAMKGVLYISEWNRDLVNELRDRWKAAGHKPTTRRTKLANLKSFFETLVRDEIIPFNPARLPIIRKNKAKRLEEEPAQKSPFSDDEINAMLRVAERMKSSGPNGSPNVIPIRREGGAQRRYEPQDLIDFIHVSIYTGLRISDVAFFHISRMNLKNEVKVRALKNNKWVRTWVPDWLAQRIRARALRNGGMVFGPYRTEKVPSVTGNWRLRLNVLWDALGPWQTEPTPHRFRHTFVRILLESGAPVSRVAELIGDTEEMIVEHYGDWVPERQESLTSVLRKAFGSDTRFRHQA